MTIESALYISQLNAAAPAPGDPISQGDDHLRLLKAVLQSNFPNLTAAAVTPSTTELNYVDGVTSNIQTQLNAIVAVNAAQDVDITALETGKLDKTGGTMSGAIVQPVAPSASNDLTNKAYVDAAIAAATALLFPPGEILWSAAYSAPYRAVLAEGQVVSQTGTYAALYAVITTTYDIGGEGPGNFRLPDLRGVVVRGRDNGRGLDPGRALGSYQADELAAHTHTTSIVGGGNAIYGGNAGGSSVAGNTGSTGGAETRMKNIALIPYIRY